MCLWFEQKLNWEPNRSSLSGLESEAFLRAQCLAISALQLRTNASVRAMSSNNRTNKVNTKWMLSWMLMKTKTSADLIYAFASQTKPYSSGTDGHWRLSLRLQRILALSDISTTCDTKQRARNCTAHRSRAEHRAEHKRREENMHNYKSSTQIESERNP